MFVLFESVALFFVFLVFLVFLIRLDLWWWLCFCLCPALAQLPDSGCKDKTELVILKSMKSIAMKYANDDEVSKYICFETDKAIGTKDQYMSNNFSGESVICKRAQALYECCKDLFPHSLILQCMLKTYFRNGEIKFLIIVFDINFGAICANQALNIPSFIGGDCLQFKLRRMPCS